MGVGLVKDIVNPVIIPTQPPFVAGSLGLKVQEWVQITSHRECINIIQGRWLHFKYQRPRVKPPCHQILSEMRQDPALDNAISEMLEMKVIQEVTVHTPVYLSRVFTVPKMERGKEYGRRFILDLKVCNLQS